MINFAFILCSVLTQLIANDFSTASSTTLTSNSTESSPITRNTASANDDCSSLHICTLVPAHRNLTELQNLLNKSLSSIGVEFSEAHVSDDCADTYSGISDKCNSNSRGIRKQLILGPFCQMPNLVSPRRLLKFLNLNKTHLAGVTISTDYTLLPNLDQQDIDELPKNTEFNSLLINGDAEHYGNAIWHLFTEHIKWKHFVLLKIIGPGQAARNRTCSRVFAKLVENVRGASDVYVQEYSWQVKSVSSESEKDKDLFRKIWFTVSTNARVIVVCADIANVFRFLKEMIDADLTDQRYAVFVMKSTFEDQTLVENYIANNGMSTSLDFLKILAYDDDYFKSVLNCNDKQSIRSTGEENKTPTLADLTDTRRKTEIEFYYVACVVKTITDAILKPNICDISNITHNLINSRDGRRQGLRGQTVLMPPLLLYSHDFQSGLFVKSLKIRQIMVNGNFGVEIMNEIQWYKNKSLEDAPYKCRNRSSFSVCEIRENGHNGNFKSTLFLIIAITGGFVLLFSLCLICLFMITWYNKRFLLRRWYIKSSELSLRDDSKIERKRTTHIGTYRKLRVIVFDVKTHLDKKTLESKEVLREVARIANYTVTNSKMVHLVGFSVVPPSDYTIVFKLGRGANLNRILRSVKLACELKFSLIRDLAKALEAVHRSFLKYHGDMRTDRCIIDERFVLRLIITRFPKLDAMNRRRRPPLDPAKALTPALLWTAPELMRSPNDEPSQPCDVYSFSLIVHEIVFQRGPFYVQDIHGEKHDRQLTASHFQTKLSNITALDDDDSCALAVLKKVRAGPLRPTILTKELENSPQLVALDALMTECWDESPARRPRFSQIVGRLEAHMKQSDVDIAFNTGKRLKAVSQNMIQDLWTKSKQAINERDRTLKYLTHMMPANFVYEYMIGRSNLIPDYYEHVTIYFNDLIKFANVLERYQTENFEVVKILDELFIAYDTIFANYDVVPLHRVGSSLLLASGVPHQNVKHAAEIAQAALQIRHFAQTYEREKLNLRAGMHTGAVMAGIVGKKIPQFGLFGDTVNTASRMASTGEINEIQMSEPVQKLLVQTSKLFVITGGEEKVVKGKGKMKTYWLKSYGKMGPISMQGRLDEMPP